MKLRLTHVLASIILALNFVAPVAAGPLEDGNAAYKRRDYATAMRILRPLANQGDGMAETIVGMMYYFNYGVPLDYVSAHMWFNLGAAHGNSLGGFMLKEVTGKMTRGEIAQAEKLAREWKPTTQSLNTTTDAETWSCEVNMHEKTFKQEWTIANGRMTAPQGKGYYRLVHYDSQVIVAFYMWRDDKDSDGPNTDYIIIEKKTGNYLKMDNIVMATMGKAYDDVAEPSITTGHCSPVEATIPSR